MPPARSLRDHPSRVSSPPRATPVNETVKALAALRRKRTREESGNELRIDPNRTAGAARSAKRRKSQRDALNGRHDVIDLTGDEPVPPGPSAPKRKRKQLKNSPGPNKPQEERRLRVFRKHAPQTFLVKLQRARTQRLAKTPPPTLARSDAN
jgi:hypothetical protein